MDERQHDKPASAPEPTTDDEEYELEAPEAAALSAEALHAREVAQTAKDSIDLDEIYREAERQRGGEILEQWLRNFQFRFQLKHLFIATAVLAIALTLSKLGLLW